MVKASVDQLFTHNLRHILNALAICRHLFHECTLSQSRDILARFIGGLELLIQHCPFRGKALVLGGHIFCGASTDTATISNILAPPYSHIKVKRYWANISYLVSWYLLLNIVPA